jgi:hypothetical protein
LQTIIAEPNYTILITMPSLVPDSLKVERDLKDLKNRSFDRISMIKEASDAKKQRVDNVNAFIVVVCHK